MIEQTAKNLNILGRFCGKRDIETLTADHLQDQYGWKRTDVMVLFGGSIVSGGDVLADAMKNGIAEKYVIVGGAGHTTDALRQKMCRLSILRPTKPKSLSRTVSWPTSGISMACGIWTGM